MKIQRFWFTTAEAAEYAGRHVVTVRRSLEAGQLHGSQRVTGGTWRIHLDCLEAWLQGIDCPHAEAQAS